MISKSTVIWLGLAGLASGALFHTSYQVQALGEDLSGLNRAIIQEQEAIQILKAEWSYMNDPNRIEEMARRHLILGPTTSDQMITSVAGIRSVSSRSIPTTRTARPWSPARPFRCRRASPAAWAASRYRRQPAPSFSPAIR